jgi:hypothetical protein
VPKYIHTHIHAYIRREIAPLRSLQTCRILAYMRAHTYTHTHIHRYIHTHIHTYAYAGKSHLSEAVKRAEYQRICGHPDGYKLPLESENAMKVMSAHDAYQNETDETDLLENMHAKPKRSGNSSSNRDLLDNMRERVGEIHDKVREKVDGVLPVAVKEGLLGTRDAIGQASRSVMAALESAATSGIDENAPHELLG